MKVNKLTNLVGLFFLITILCGCTLKEHVEDSKLFSKLDAEITGISFKNTLTENDSLNYFTYSYLYMGGGIATGDINNDGLVDIYFTGNQVANKLYLNKGNLQFEDITENAGVQGDNRWYTGVTMADVNGDGFLDIYCSVGGKFSPKENQLFINNRDNTFTEQAAQYGVADIGNSVQGTFFDYDKDGDLDLYVANYPPTKFNSPTFVYVNKMKNVLDHESDHLYEYENGSFRDVTNKAGLKSFGLSLSATIGDLNNDSWPDIYVSNDFNSPDYMYQNNQDGTFKEVLKKATSQTSFYGMGVDIADFNNDGHLDIFQVDMDAQSNRRKKANMASMNIALFWDVVKAGFHYQYMQNSLQFNTGIIKDSVPYFSNVSRITGTSSTDWSWGPLFADFDNDGKKDLFISNGTRREINNNDYFNSLNNSKIEKDSLLALSLKIPSEKIDNFIYQNKGDLKFEQVNDAWGIEDKGFSNGVVYVDLDNDGDLEIITNNIDDTASVFENKSSSIHNYITISFAGNSNNTFGVGNRVIVESNSQQQMQELTLTRGFQSSVAPKMHFGVGNTKIIDKIKVIWTDGTIQTLHDIKTNQHIILNQSKAVQEQLSSDLKQGLFNTISNDSIFPKYRHQENYFDDFKKQVLLPHKMSTTGPVLAVGDINNDGLEDYFVGGAAGYSGVVYIQNEDRFQQLQIPALEKDKSNEDAGAILFDADGDGDNDLYVVSGGYEFLPGSDLFQDRLYINDGHGGFIKDVSALPQFKTSGSKVYYADFDKDGKEDLFVLGRQVPGKYPSPANSYLLKNNTKDGKVKFDFFLDMQTEEFRELGMATSAVITDYNNDNWLDIIVVGEWMPIRVFQNTKSGFKEVSESLGLGEDTVGWWWDIAQGDFDNDGDMDYVVGNNGLNYKYKANGEETFDIFLNDFDNDSNEDIVLSYYNEGEQYPVRGRECSSQQIPGIKQKFKDYESFSKATLSDIYTEKSLSKALHYQVKSFASIYIENQGDTFKLHKLPNAAQVSNINKILIDDFDKDNQLDVLIGGNLFDSEVETPRNDAGFGLFLKGDGNGNLTPIKAKKSGWFIPGNVKDMDKIRVKEKSFIIVAKNNDDFQFVQVVNE